MSRKHIMIAAIGLASILPTTALAQSPEQVPGEDPPPRYGPEAEALGASNRRAAGTGMLVGGIVMTSLGGLGMVAGAMALMTCGLGVYGGGGCGGAAGAGAGLLIGGGLVLAIGIPLTVSGAHDRRRAAGDVTLHVAAMPGGIGLSASF